MEIPTNDTESPFHPDNAAKHQSGKKFMVSGGQRWDGEAFVPADDKEVPSEHIQTDVLVNGAVNRYAVNLNNGHRQHIAMLLRGVVDTGMQRAIVDHSLIDHWASTVVEAAEAEQERAREQTAYDEVVAGRVSDAINLEIAGLKLQYGFAEEQKKTVQAAGTGEDAAPEGTPIASAQ